MNRIGKIAIAAALSGALVFTGTTAAHAQDFRPGDGAALETVVQFDKQQLAKANEQLEAANQEVNAKQAELNKLQNESIAAVQAAADAGANLELVKKAGGAGDLQQQAVDEANRKLELAENKASIAEEELGRAKAKQTAAQARVTAISKSLEDNEKNLNKFREMEKNLEGVAEGIKDASTPPATNEEVTTPVANEETPADEKVADKPAAPEAEKETPADEKDEDTEAPKSLFGGFFSSLLGLIPLLGLLAALFGKITLPPLSH